MTLSDNGDKPPIGGDARPLGERIAERDDIEVGRRQRPGGLWKPCSSL